MFYFVQILQILQLMSIVHLLIMARRLTISAARKDFTDIVNRAFYGQEVTVVTKHGKDLAAVVPMNSLSQEEAPPPKKRPQREN